MLSQYYFDDPEHGLRLCLPTGLIKEVFQLAHNELGHPGYACTHQCLTQGLYIHNLLKQLHEFIWHCPQCQLNQTPRHAPYGSMQPILTPPRPFHTITVDFILGLPILTAPDCFDCVMSVTDKVSKAVTFVPSKIAWGGKEWASALLLHLDLIG